MCINGGHVMHIKCCIPLITSFSLSVLLVKLNYFPIETSILNFC